MSEQQESDDKPLPAYFYRDGDAIKIRWPVLLRGAVGAIVGMLGGYSLIQWVLGQPLRFSILALQLAFGVSLLAFLFQRQRDQLQLGDDAPRWPRIGLGNLLLMTTAFATAFAWFGMEQRYDARIRAKQQAVVDELEEQVPNVSVSFSHPWGEAMLTSQGLGPTDADIEVIDQIMRREFPDGPRAWALILSPAPITDRSLEIISGWRGVRHLDVSNTSVTNAGVDHLLNLTELEDLYYSGTSITRERVDRLIEEMPSLGSEHRTGYVFEPD